ncbi:MAG: hypothetical protein EOO90_17100 [Pedobacter sp.]|nr:MAG: hypothetical protein EOO90_17100 [Pedobacter sp.]
MEIIPKTPPYLYQSDYCNFAEIPQHHGFYVDNVVNKYRYKISNDFQYRNDDKWNEFISLNRIESFKQHESSEYGVISGFNLLQNLANCVEQRSWFKFMQRTMLLTDEIISDITTAKIREAAGATYTDCGERSNYLLVYDPQLDVYTSTLLSTYGQYAAINKSIYIQKLIDCFGMTRFGPY